MAKRKTTNTYEQVDVIPPACKACGSTERDGYHEIKRFDIKGTTANGFEYDRMSLKRTKCRNCGQCRIDRIFEKIGTKKNNSASRRADQSKSEESALELSHGNSSGTQSSDRGD